MGNKTKITDETLTSAKILWNYLKMDQPLCKSDLVVAMGSHDVRTAKYAAQLVLDEWAPLLLCSGGLGRLTNGIWQETEADRFAEAAMQAGVPAGKILRETRSTNTGENLVFSKTLWEQNNLPVTSVLLVQKPYMERRLYAAARLKWPKLSICVSSPPISFEAYPTQDIPMDTVIHIMVGDFQRILLYPQKGFAIPQPVPESVQMAFDHLVNCGFVDQLIDH